MTDADPLAAMPAWAKAWTPWWTTAMQSFSQPILPGWSFGSVTVNEQNSSAPGTEQAILSSQSYGRQIGKLLDAVCAQIEAQGGPKDVVAYKDVVALREKVEQIKRDAAAARIDQFQRDLELLKSADPAAFEEKAKALESLLPRRG
jgi:hypothetical protein